MANFYTISKILLEDYDGCRQECPVEMILPLYQRTESKPTRLIEDKWLNWCNEIYQHSWTKIRFIIKYL